MHPRGFTLIELLVVIAIIGVLASVILPSLSVARERARDTNRLSDVRAMVTALELYASDHNGRYPLGSGALNWNSNPPYYSYDSRNASQWADLRNLLAPYIDLPVDPTNNQGDGLMCGNCGEYYYGTDGKVFMLSTYLAQPTATLSGVNQYGPYVQYASGCTGVDFWRCTY